ncbi:Clan CE, family C48, Ulp1-like cysteine peptidase [Trichomonas vaginalis G3]|uniref:Clan CE, family C48, Ulp1-like cysteine peptidase n=1 Tax=Trichomonas vaginalis (strain ATCC PRA-98 / G3) TaxID=412133 RepID=A2DKJ8_TRIV3|nr:protease family [Trichomonas vaginalis G3]EAY18981.1 Clan CE, family C48, Ulp1-like cysteine peptidase [Trichomonas vaginalis G3]KAI5521226.1 protease family [Trichomonas vaginalis G3]|eukprot:XP_001579967.1 Clan CE, family C48, Ulp1-like cysteine peptidase [Trichomonas vaginalis G3]
MSNSKYIYSFENLLITQTDADLIKNCQWINDTLIHLAGRKIELENLKETEDGKKNIMFYPPNTLQLLRMLEKPFIDDIINNFKVFTAKYVFLPLNNGGLGADHGSHWSLIIWDTEYSPNQENKFYHYDSIGGSTTKLAKSVCKQLADDYGVKYYKFFAPKSPQQDNTYDCGLFTVAVTDYVAKTMDLEHIIPNVSQETVTNLRNSFITRFMK